MKKTIKVGITALTPYLNNEETIVSVVKSAIENFDPFLFLRARSAALKEEVIYGMEMMWDKAAVLAQQDTTPIKHTIKIVMDDLEHAQTCLALGGCNLYGKLSYHWKIFRLNQQKLPLLDLLALHIAEHGNKPEEKEEILQQLRQNIITADDLVYMVHAGLPRQLAPSKCPDSLKPDEVPYLRTLCLDMRQKRYSTEALREAWSKMLEKKSQQVDSSNWKGLLPPEDALYVLFEKMDYNEVKRHYAAYLSFISDEN